MRPGNRDGHDTPELRVLLVEDNSADAELVLRELRRDGFNPVSHVVQSADEFRQAIRAHPPDIVLADYNLGQWRGMDALDIMKEEGLEIPLILVSGALGDVTAVECIKRGATDYVLKDTLARLPVSIRRALEEKRLQQEGKAAQTALAAKVEELANSNRELEQFAYVASHDLQEPLRMVASYTQLLGERYRGRLDPQADKYIGYAVEGATRMQTLIQDLLAFSRFSRPGVERRSVDCDLAIGGALQNLQAAIQESGAVILRESLPAVMGNAVQLQQVFQNLIGNAIKFRGHDAPVIQVEAKPLGDDWLFSVQDNGIGIAPEQVEGIFTIFKRLHTRTEYPGNGIGLAICKKIITQNGGKIWVEPSAGTGTLFQFTLPAATPTGSERVWEKEKENEKRIASVAGR